MIALTTNIFCVVASEIMAVLALSNDFADLRRRLGNMVVGYSRSGDPVTADDIGCTGALTVLMKDAVMPTLMQTVEKSPVLVHAGPFANIAVGNSSIIADKIALKAVGPNGFVCTEAGFGADIGAEKFFNIKCRTSKLHPQCAVIVATIRALKMHGGGAVVTPGKPLSAEYMEENVELVKAGAANLVRHIENCRKFGVHVVVAINRFKTDTEAEIAAVKKAALDAGAFDAVMSNHWAEGGAGAEELGKAVVRACEDAKSNNFKLLYEDSCSIKEKIEIVCREIYRAVGVDFSELAEKQITQYEKSGFGNLPICIAKTQYSFSCDAEAKGAPTGFRVPVREVRSCAGGSSMNNGFFVTQNRKYVPHSLVNFVLAGFLYPLCGQIMTIPGLPTRPGFFDVDINTETGEVIGLF